MRSIPWKVLMIGAFITNLLIAGCMWSYLDVQCDCSNIHRKYSSYSRIVSEKHREETRSFNGTENSLSERIAVVIRDFEFFENDLPDTIKSIAEALKNVMIYIITDKTPYPPISIYEEYKNSVKVINMKPALNSALESHHPLNVIDREHILIVPDATRIESESQVLRMLDLHYEDPNKIIAAPFQGRESTCLALNVSLRYWTIKYGKKVESSDCNALEGPHVLMVTKALMLHLAFPFTRPLFTSLYIQASLLKIKTVLSKDVSFSLGKELFSDAHHQWKHKALEEQRRSSMFHDFGIKKVIYPAARVEWHGCDKSTPRCFGTVVDSTPEYLFEGRWTPPCCMEHLRQTARYVFSILEKCGVRYWLEGGSLLGAVRTGDIIPWDYDVDVGIYKEDIDQCSWLKNCLQQSFLDQQGFLWQRANEGDFLRVQFSETNHLHVDLFPFFSRNGTMTKETWFVDHPQDCEFPERYLLPRVTVKFVGVDAAAPNNYREFLELKFGKGAIENPEYPNPKLVKFARRSG